MTQLPLVSAESVSSPTATTGGGCGCGGCGCGAGGGDAAQQDAVTPDAATDAQAVQPGDLDVRALPHAQRHERIFGAVAALLPGESFVLVNDHDPARLRHHLELREPGQIGWTPLAEGPQAWRVRISRAAGHCC